MTRKDFEALAQLINESRMLGLFVDSNAADIFTRELGQILDKTNLHFDGELFETAAGVQPIRYVTAGTIKNGIVTEVLIDCD